MPKSCLKFTANQTSLLWQMVKMMLWWTFSMEKAEPKASLRRACPQFWWRFRNSSCRHRAEVLMKSFLYHLPGTLRQKSLTLQLPCGHDVTSNTILHKGCRKKDSRSDTLLQHKDPNIKLLMSFFSSQLLSVYDHHWTVPYMVIRTAVSGCVLKKGNESGC